MRNKEQFQSEVQKSYLKLSGKKVSYQNCGPLKTKATLLAIKTVHLYKHLVHNEREFVMSKQILKSGTSIGANLSESKHAQTRPDFITKLSIAHKETGESSFWLDILYATGFVDDLIFDEVNQDLIEIEKIISSSLLTAKNNAKKQ